MDYSDDPNYLGSRTCPYTDATIHLWDTNEEMRPGFWKLRAALEQDGKLIFKNEIIGCPKDVAVDSDESFSSAIHLIASGPNADFGPEFFTQDQLDFIDEYGEQLSLFAYELEEDNDSQPIHQRD